MMNLPFDLLPSAQDFLAYIGPGAGMGLLTALFGFLSAIVAAIVGAMFWPIRNYLRRKRMVQSADQAYPSSQVK